MKKLFIYCVKLFSILCFFHFASVCKADTLLVGFDSTLVTNSCWLTNAATIDNYSWKAFRSRAHASGTISYFKWGTSYEPTGCTHDSGCWAIYEESNSGKEVVGNLKAYNCFAGYDWTKIGVGSHALPVVTTVTDLEVIAGNYYWLVMWSNAIDYTNYNNAGCTAYPFTQRLRNISGCNTANMDGMMATTDSSYPPPPAGSQINIPVQTTIAWGVWKSESQPPDNIPPAAPTGLTVQ